MRNAEKRQMRLSSFTAKRIALSGLFLALALIVGLIENMLPPIVPALPYAKLGLGNVVLLACFLLVGVWQGYIVLILRCFLIAAFSGNFASMLWSVPASLVAYTAMVLLAKSGFFSTIGTSVAGAMLHNAMQILVATLIIGQSVLVYLPYMLVAGAIAGFVTGIVCHFVVEALKNKTNLPSLKNEEYFREVEEVQEQEDV
ncbi:MAG: Gx transporter family protein [Clostridia bacterium]|nr:Gx transporter family protein [Clostridia bacterium]